MKLTIVGCSGSFPGPDSPASCYLIEAPYEGRVFRILLDLGNGALGALQRYAELESIDAVLLSHLHADHCIDLCGFYVVRKYRPDGALPLLPVYGPEGTSERIRNAYDLPDEEVMTSEFDFREYPEDAFPLGPFEVVATQVDHPVVAFGLRVTAGGRTLAYTGDTGPCSALVDLAKGADLLLAEASFIDTAVNPPNLHLTGSQAAQAATAAGVRRLVLTHVPPWYSRDEVFAEAQPHFSGEASMATPGATYDI